MFLWGLRHRKLLHVNEYSDIMFVVRSEYSFMFSFDEIKSLPELLITLERENIPYKTDKNDNSFFKK